MDTHNDTISVGVAEAGRGEPVYEREIANEPRKVFKLVEHLHQRYEGQELLWCYEAGPCGYVLYHQLMELGEECQVVAPSKTPRKPGDRVKTDRRDALILARQLRSGDLTAVWVPDSEQEAMRDLTRTRDDFKAQEQKARQQLNAFVLRHGRHWPTDKTRWTRTHYNWLESLTFEHPWLPPCVRIVIR
uniref:Transposase n=2 Tax=Candidatus Kentrum sp. LPFa TaxID=2126335 RepID=A0A450X662_9GAMM|nr:MAG: Transposase [Candidatus Kentron sp. LPFa]